MTEIHDLTASFSIDPACLKLVVKHADSDHMITAAVVNAHRLQSTQISVM